MHFWQEQLWLWQISIILEQIEQILALVMIMANWEKHSHKLSKKEKAKKENKSWKLESRHYSTCVHKVFLITE